MLSPGQIFFYKVGGTTADGKVLSSNGYEFNTTGVDLTVIVLDQEGAAISDANVTILGKSVTTDKNGKAVINDLPPGDQKGTVKYKNNVTSFNVKIQPYSAKNDKQELTVKIKDSLLDNPLILIIPLIGIGGLIVLAVLRLIGHNRQTAEMARHFPFEGKKPPSPPPNNPSNASYAPGTVINGAAGASPVPPVPIPPASPTPALSQAPTPPPPPGTVQEPAIKPNPPVDNKITPPQNK